MDILGLVIGLAGGALGGNVAGGAMKSSMGTTGRSITGIVGGFLLSLVAQKLGISLGDPTAGGSLDIMSIVSNDASVIQYRRQPAFGIFKAHVFTASIIFDLVFFNFTNAEIKRFGMPEINA